MKTKFFILVVLFLGIGAFSYAQSTTAAPAEKKDAAAQVVTPEAAKTGECPGHQTTTAKMECKWVDADKDGKCDTCGKTEKECKEKCSSETMKSCDPAACPHHKAETKPAETAPPK